MGEITIDVGATAGFDPPHANATTQTQALQTLAHVHMPGEPSSSDVGSRRIFANVRPTVTILDVSAKPTILVLDDDPSVRHLLKVLLEKAGYAVIAAADAASALAQCGVQLPDLMVVDLMLPIDDGEMFLFEFRRRWRQANTPVILLSASTARNEIARDLRVAASLGKPFFSEDLLELVDAHLPAQEPAVTV